MTGPPVDRTSCESTGTKSARARTGAKRAATIWIDLDNTPHVPFFKPIIRELEGRGYRVALTARDAFQVCDLAAQSGLRCRTIGRHYGKNRVMKVAGLALRGAQLLPFLFRERPALALSHGSRAQLLVCNLWRIPTVMVMDYEHAEMPGVLRPRWEIVPEVLLNADLQCKRRDRVRAYPGIKEDVYAPEFRPDPALARQLGLDGEAIVVTVRPPANEAHYHNPESEVLFNEVMKLICETEGVRAVLLPRNKAQEAQLRSACPEWFAGRKVIVPTRAVDGLNLLWHSDLVISGGGTMNREAAALGIPVYSIFRGKTGAVDRHLQQTDRMRLLASVEDVRRVVALRRRERTAVRARQTNQALATIVRHVAEILELERAG